MPTRLIQCKQAGCPALIAAGRYCPAHVTDNTVIRQRKEYDKLRDGDEHRRIYGTARWKRLRAVRLREFPFCEIGNICVRRKGHAAVSTDVHHLKGVVEFPLLAWEYSNLQAACHECHASETARNEGWARKKKEEEK